MKTIRERLLNKGFKPFSKTDWYAYAGAEGNAMIRKGKYCDYIYSEEEGISPTVCLQFTFDIKEEQTSAYLFIYHPSTISFDELEEDINYVIEDKVKNNTLESVEHRLKNMLDKCYGMELLNA